MDHPKLRYGLEALPVEYEGRHMIMLRDRLGYSPDPLLLSPALAAIVTRMSGHHSQTDLKAQFLTLTGQFLMQEQLDEILKMLDEHLFLENERFIRTVAQEVARFRQDPIRRMQHAGRSYPTDPGELRSRLESFYLPENGGPGLPQPGTVDRTLVGLVAPHIDIQAGGPCFANAFKAVAEAASPATWVVLGTGHEPLDNFLALTAKGFETPLGVVECDSAFCQALADRSPVDLFASELNHQREHTVEFQAVFLAHSHPGTRIVPLLCSFSYEDLDTHGETIEHLARLLRDLAAEHPVPVGFLASVDLAHIGPRYGDLTPPGRATLQEHLDADRELIEILERSDAALFMDKIRRQRNQRRVCGVAPLYLLARILEHRAEGELLSHAHAVVDPQGSFVTFASMAFYQSDRTTTAPGP